MYYFAIAAAAQNRVWAHLLAVPLPQPLLLPHSLNNSISFNGIRCRTVWTDLYTLSV